MFSPDCKVVGAFDVYNYYVNATFLSTPYEWTMNDQRRSYKQAIDTSASYTN